jgi:hypothetical protein
MSKTTKRQAAPAEDGETPWTMPVPAAGKKYFGTKSRSAAYALAAKGLMATIRLDGKILALPRVIERQLNGDVAA